LLAEAGKRAGRFGINAAHAEDAEGTEKKARRAGLKPGLYKSSCEGSEET